MNELSTLGLDPDEERVYRTLLVADEEQPADELAGSLRLPVPHLRRVLARLEADGLVTRSGRAPVRWSAAAPEPAFEALLARRQEELESARRAAAELDREFRRKHGSGSDVVTTIVGRQAIGAQVDRLDQTARHELLVLVKPPFVTSSIDKDAQTSALDRGVPTRVIYDREVLETPGAFENLARVAAGGERARIVAGVPLKLVIADRSLGLLPLHLGEPHDFDRAMLVRASALLDALVMLFEALWRSSDPAPWAPEQAAEHPDGVSEVDARLLSLLAAGYKDEAIARQSGLGLRTVRRRVSDLMERLGAHTRFQAGVRAAERGWLSGR